MPDVALEEDKVLGDLSLCQAFPFRLNHSKELQQQSLKHAKYTLNGRNLQNVQN